MLKGLKAGERIATSANFLIDSESQLAAALGSFAPPPPGVGAAAAMNAPQGATLEYSSDPSTPRAGSNNFRVKLTGAINAPRSFTFRGCPRSKDLRFATIDVRANEWRGQDIFPQSQRITQAA